MVYILGKELCERQMGDKKEEEEEATVWSVDDCRGVVGVVAGGEERRGEMRERVGQAGL